MSLPDIGRMDRSVTIESLTSSRSSTTGAPVQSWSTLGVEYMSLQPIRGFERFTSNQVSSYGDSVWRMHYREDMDPELVDVPKTRRLSMSGRTYDIVSAVHVGLGEGIEIVTMASTRTPS